MSRPLCIYHGNCADGFTAAWAVREALKDVDFHPGIYGQEPPDVAGRDVILVDFSYKRPVLEKMLQSGDVKQANTILILDHHKTAAEDLAGLSAPEENKFDPRWWRSNWEQECAWPVRCLFDMERSGAQMAWDFFFPGKPRPILVDYVGDRDLWKFKMPGSREMAALIFSYPYEFDSWTELVYRCGTIAGREAMISEGRAIERKHHKDIAELVKVTRRTMRIGGIEMPVANLPYTLTSDAGNLMAKSANGVAACYWDTPNGRVFSLRSTEDGPDVSEIAKGYGGGGHKHAAGFQRSIGWEGDDAEQKS